MNKFFALLWALTSLTTFAGQSLVTSSFQEIEKKALELGKKHGESNVLIVLDIDNTILTMPQSLGSDQWFTWQYNDCIKMKKQETYCTGRNMGELLKLQGQLFALSKMIPTEADAPKTVKNLQSKGFKVILLTSRGPDYRNSTERELKRNGYDLRKSSIGPKGGYPATYIPYDMKNLKLSGITKEEAAVAKLKKARKISYMNGVMMTSGLNKGIMLKSLLAKTKTKFKGIIFADDHEKHTKRMQAILGNKKDIELVTFRYGKIDPQVKSFNKSDKKEVIKAFNTFQKTLKTVFK